MAEISHYHRSLASSVHLMVYVTTKFTWASFIYRYSLCQYLLDYLVLFFFQIKHLYICVILGIIPSIMGVMCKEVSGSWEVGDSCGVVGVGGQAKDVPSLPLRQRQWCYVLTVGDREVHNPQNRSRWPLAVVLHPTNSD